MPLQEKGRVLHLALSIVGRATQECTVLPAQQLNQYFMLTPLRWELSQV